MRAYILAFAIIGFTASSASATQEYSASWFSDHQRERDGVIRVCQEYASQAKTNVNCQNAFQGSLIASARDAGKRSHTPTAAETSAWSDPKNADTRAFWARQCKVAEMQGRPPQVLNSMSCYAIKASGGY